MVVVNALGPVFLLVLLGIGLHYLQLPGGDFWPRAERLTYFVFFPCLLVHSLALAPFTAGELFEVLLVVLVLFGVAAFALILSARWLAPSEAAFTSVFQGALRFNTYVGFAAAAGIWGEDGVATAALVVACMVPLVNVLSIVVFALKLGRSASVVSQVALNPLVIACALGVALNLSAIGLPGWSEPLLAILGRPALPLGLLAIGVGLSFTGLRRSIPALAAVTGIKLLLLPLLAFAVCRALALASPYAEVVVLFAALPTASSAYILSRQLGGDSPLMAAIITTQTVAAMVLMPLMLEALL